MMTRVRPIVLAGLVTLVAPALPAAERVFDGEIVARSSEAISPPKNGETFQLTLTQLAPDGAAVKAGDVVAQFDGADLQRQLDSARGKQQEKYRERERLLLELAERERATAIETAESRATFDKAARKAEQPQSLVPGNDYKKLVIERAQAERQVALMIERERLSAIQRREERELVEAELAQLDAQVAKLQADLASLTVKARRDGVVQHQSDWQGQKFDVGSNVFVGQNVAQIPDLSTLIVRMQIPERELRFVRVDDRVRVAVEGGAGVVFDGRVIEIGRAVRSKSRVQPVPVIDAVIEFGQVDAKLRSGQPVRVTTVTDGERRP
jgi:multidrug resistance efflux pump